VSAALDVVLPSGCQRAARRVIERYEVQCAGALTCIAEAAKREAERESRNVCQCGLAKVDHL
jgi:hypothetical protein